MIEKYNKSNLKEKQANKQAVDFFANDFATGFKPNAQTGDPTAFKDKEIQKRTANTSIKYTDTTRS